MECLHSGLDFCFSMVILFVYHLFCILPRASHWDVSYLLFSLCIFGRRALPGLLFLHFSSLRDSLLEGWVSVLGLFPLLHGLSVSFLFSLSLPFFLSVFFLPGARCSVLGTLELLVHLCTTICISGTKKISSFLFTGNFLFSRLSSLFSGLSLHLESLYWVFCDSTDAYHSCSTCLCPAVLPASGILWALLEK